MNQEPRTNGRRHGPIAGQVYVSPSVTTKVGRKAGANVYRVVKVEQRGPHRCALCLRIGALRLRDGGWTYRPDLDDTLAVPVHVTNLGTLWPRITDTQARAAGLELW